MLSVTTRLVLTRPKPTVIYSRPQYQPIIRLPQLRPKQRVRQLGWPIVPPEVQPERAFGHTQPAYVPMDA